MHTTHFHRDLTIDGDRDAVFRLIAEIGHWPALFPHIRAVEQVQRNRWAVRASWRWVPLAFLATQRVEHDVWRVEQRFGARPGVRIRCRWSLQEVGGQQTRLALDLETVRGWWPLRVVVTELVDQTLEMIALLAESDRIAHREIE